MKKALALAPFALLASCAYPGGDHEGYMDRSYTVRGNRYHPMDVEQDMPVAVIVVDPDERAGGQDPDAQLLPQLPIQGLSRSSQATLDRGV